MAAHRCGLSLVIILIFSSLAHPSSCDTLEKADGNVGEKQGVSDAHREVNADGSVTGEDLNERQWQSTDVELDRSDGTEDSEPFRPAPAKDEFQEELVIRPLHSGDIYASFQFRTLWDTDFLQEGQKGELSSLMNPSLSHSNNFFLYITKHASILLYTGTHGM